MEKLFLFFMVKTSQYFAIDKLYINAKGGEPLWLPALFSCLLLSISQRRLRRCQSGYWDAVRGTGYIV
jgi:hypothetical protein